MSVTELLQEAINTRISKLVFINESIARLDDDRDRVTKELEQLEEELRKWKERTT